MAATAAKGVHEVAASGFSIQVEDYEQGRPSYPQEAVSFALAQLWADGNPTPKCVLDLAAGTGKFTRLLAEQQLLHVEAVEPVEAMREAFNKSQASWNVTRPVPCLPGTARDLPFESSSFDAVYIAQAFHWFANEAALQEVHRVLRPGGALVMLWNREDDSIPWQAQLLHTFEPLSAHVPQYYQGTWREAFDNSFARKNFGVQDAAQHSQMFWSTRECTRQQLLARFRSRSYIAVLDPPQKAAVMQQLEALLDEQAEQFHRPSPAPTNGWELASEHTPAPEHQEPVIDVVMRTEVFVCVAS